MRHGPSPRCYGTGRRQKLRLVCDSVSDEGRARLRRIESPARNTLPRRLTLFLALALSALALVQSVHRAKQGRSALLKWRPDVEALLAGDEVYGRDAETLDEGFPTLPLTALVLAPFLWLEDVPANLLWSTLKVALAWWMVLTALRLASNRRAWPGWSTVLVLALSCRVLLSDLSHGNINILVGATIVAAAVAWSRGHDVRAGLWIGLGTVLKATPALFILFFAWKRSPRALAGWLIGLALFAFLVPGALLGWERNLDLAGAWWTQMAEPFLAGAPPTLVQTEHINQSYLGVLARLLTDAVAIDAHPPRLVEAIQVNVMSLSNGALHAVLAVTAALTLGWIALCVRAREDSPRDRAPHTVLGEFALVALAMLFLSERSWKHHYVLLMLPIAFLAWTAWDAHAPRHSHRIATLGLLATALLHGLSGSGVLGSHGSDLAEAYGVFLLGGLALFVSCGRVLPRAAAPS